MVESTSQQKITRNIEEEKSNSTNAVSSTAERNAANNMVTATKDEELVIDTSEQLEIVSTFD